MTPATQRDLWATGRWVRPRKPTADDHRIVWAQSWADDAAPAFDINRLLDDYCALAQAQPEEMARFVATYGVPEVDGFEVTDGSQSNPGGVRVQTERAGSVPVYGLREHSRAVGAARRVAASLVSRRAGDHDDWIEVTNSLSPWPGCRLAAEDVIGDWALEREHFAEVLSDYLRDSSVIVMADWVGARGLAIEPTAGSLLGAIAILLAREVGAEGEYLCDACGARVARRRPPRTGERVYCTRIECKREQQRRNQAAWRAKKSGGYET